MESLYTGSFGYYDGWRLISWRVTRSLGPGRIFEAIGVLTIRGRGWCAQSCNFAFCCDGLGESCEFPDVEQKSRRLSRNI